MGICQRLRDMEFRTKERTSCDECKDCKQWDYCLGGALHTWNFKYNMQNKCTYKMLYGEDSIWKNTKQNISIFYIVVSFPNKIFANVSPDKLIIVPENKNYTNEQICVLTEFQEQYFESKIIRIVNEKSS